MVSYCLYIHFYYSLLVTFPVYHGSNPPPWHKKEKVMKSEMSQFSIIYMVIRGWKCNRKRQKVRENEAHKEELLDKQLELKRNEEKRRK
jgi:hypothetical protein